MTVNYLKNKSVKRTIQSLCNGTYLQHNRMCCAPETNIVHHLALPSHMPESYYSYTADGV